MRSKETEEIRSKGSDGSFRKGIVTMKEFYDNDNRNENENAANNAANENETTAN